MEDLLAKEAEALEAMDTTEVVAEAPVA